MKCGKRPCAELATHSVVNRERGTVSYRCNEHILAFGPGRYSIEPLEGVGDSLGEEIDDAEMAEQLGKSPSSDSAGESHRE